ncbi:uncharacterized protein LOC128997788 [Macrosteles quadrilineatus]|uniref:uncharacterized protein LOC128997788 n=1 Tax=Macrosteles quadrilineatus TaxID=74068 RepID=UPI0023E13657|nr:uncharacterized protein LOC128997788 [Macrosteles quadrilineatus]XP_054279457.1 uncharacterized protein LOC128997788 [Macrosteles quadrilineatus]XP_054279458.1 uncharacterized protein LOC128997788 [Macrosteles quadrilineatus]
MVDTTQDQIVMTPKGKTATSTTLMIERKKIQDQRDVNNENIHVAGGAHQGIVINKTTASGVGEDVAADLSLEFRVYLVNAQTGNHTLESRTLLFWFCSKLPEVDQPHVAQEFFKELVAPQEFPRDYVGFIKKIMKLMQHKYPTIRKLEIILRQLEQATSLPTRPLSADESTLGKLVILTEEKVLELIESAYPNPITAEDMAREHNWEEELVVGHLLELQKKGLVKAMEHGAYTRIVQHDTDVQIVKQMPTMVKAKQPTIAIITAQYCEKLAVDAMIENKETFVRYTTVGESNVYTLGTMGAHRIVCTKLPTVGHTREAMTAAGNTTTRLLGTFQQVEYVFLVGVGGGVPHYTDWGQHVRLGDVVVSHLGPDRKSVYTYCESGKERSDGSVEFDHKDYCPVNLLLQDIATHLKQQSDTECDKTTWLRYLKKGQEMLQSQSEHDFCRPPTDTDKLYMCIGERDIIEVAHPTPADTIQSARVEGLPRLHLGPILSGRAVCKDDSLRQIFSQRCGAKAWDPEFDSVIESVMGNCKDSFAVVRGIADYRDGTRKSPWQAYASLAAASVVKAIISAMDPPV